MSNTARFVRIISEGEKDDLSLHEPNKITYINNYFVNNFSETFPENTSHYLLSLPNEYDIFSNTIKKLDLIKINATRDLVNNFIISFNKEFIGTLKNERIEHVFPKVLLNIDEDGAVLLEWPFPDFRFGFIFDSNAENSTWFLVSNKNLEELWVSGVIDASNPELTIQKIINYSIGNT